MAVFPDKIVLKSTTDGNTSVRQGIGPGQADEIVPGEIVVSRENSRASLFTLDANNSVVEIGAGTDVTATASQVRPSLLLNFDGDADDTSADSSSVQSSYPSTLDKKFGIGGLRLNNDGIDVRYDTLFVYGNNMPDLGTYRWTLSFWIKTSLADWYTSGYPRNGPLSTWLSIMGPSNYRSGPGALHVYMDNGTADTGGTGSSTSRASGMARGAICLGLGPGETGSDYPDGIPATGEIVTSGSVSVADNNWHHVAIQHEGTGVYSVFIDGVLGERVTIPASINYSDPGSSGITMPPDLEIGAPGDVLSGTAYIKPGMNGFLDAISLHVGAVLYAGVDTFEVPTSAPDDSLQGSGYNYLGALFDVHLTTPVQDMDILAYDATLERWYNYPAPPVDLSGGYLGELADVDLTTTAPVVGDALSFDGTNWVPQSFATSFAELSDVQLLIDVAVASSWGLPAGPLYDGAADSRVILQPNSTSVYAYAGLSSWGNGNVSLVGGQDSGNRSVINLSQANVYFSDNPSSAPDGDEWSVSIEVSQTSNNRIFYREFPALGADASDLTVPAMGQVRAGIIDRATIISNTAPVLTPAGDALVEGSTWWNSEDGSFSVYHSGAWVEISGGTGSGSGGLVFWGGGDFTTGTSDGEAPDGGEFT